MRSIVFGSLVLLAGCSESWVYAPTASVTVRVEEGTSVVEGEATLTWDRAGFPEEDEIVSNALRLEATSSRKETLTLAFPDADARDLGTFVEPNLLNLNEVFHQCDAARCEAIVPFEVTRERTNPAVIEISGDAILSVESVQHRTRPENDAASLEIVFY